MIVPPEIRITHKGLIGPCGEVGALCFEPPHSIDQDLEYVVMSEWLHDEVTCSECLVKLGRPLEVSRGRLLRDNVAIRLNIAFNFIDANYWNRMVRKPGEKKINPDPDGFLASEFIKLNEQFDVLMKPILTMMQKHEGKFGWPEIVSDNKDDS